MRCTITESRTREMTEAERQAYWADVARRVSEHDREFGDCRDRRHQFIMVIEKKKWVRQYPFAMPVIQKRAFPRVFTLPVLHDRLIPKTWDSKCIPVTVWDIWEREKPRRFQSIGDAAAAIDAVHSAVGNAAQCGGIIHKRWMVTYNGLPPRKKGDRRVVRNIRRLSDGRRFASIMAAVYAETGIMDYKDLRNRARHMQISRALKFHKPDVNGEWWEYIDAYKAMKAMAMRGVAA